MAGLKVRSGGSWVDAANFRFRSGGSWVQPQTVRVRQDGAWVTVWIAYTPMTNIVAAPTSVYEETNLASRTTPPVGVSVSGGALTKTYSWSWVSNSGGLVIDNPSSPSTSFTRGSMVTNTSYSGTARCVVSDGVTSLSVDVPVTIRRGTIS